MLKEENLELVYSGVMKDKKGKYTPGTNSFMIRTNKDYFLRKLQQILYERSFKPAKPRLMERMERGKLRTIQAPQIFPDQFVHWSIMLQLQPIFMKGMDKWCCASIKGRGTLYAKNFIEKNLRAKTARTKYKYCLKMDIKKFFQNIDKDILVNKLKRKIKDPEIIDLCEKIIYSIKEPGIPLGYYTSQWFANFYLEEFDRHMRQVLLPKYNFKPYIRYMDDMLVLGSNKRKLYKLMEDINLELDKIGLTLKDTSRVFSIEEQPIDFIGYRFSYDKTILRKSILNNAVKSNFRVYGKKFKIKNLQSSISYNGWLTHSDTKQYRKDHMKGHINIEKNALSKMIKKELIRKKKNPTRKEIHDSELEFGIYKLKRSEFGIPVLIKYDKNKDTIRIVSRCSFVLPHPPNKKRMRGRTPHRLYSCILFRIRYINSQNLILSSTPVYSTLILIHLSKVRCNIISYIHQQGL